MSEWRFIRAARAQGIINICNGHEAGREGDGFTLRPVGVSGTIPAFVMATRNLGCKMQHEVVFTQLATRSGQHAFTFGTVCFHDLELFRCVFARFEQNVVGDGDLADVVQGRRFGDLVDVLEG